MGGRRRRPGRREERGEKRNATRFTLAVVEEETRSAYAERGTPDAHGTASRSRRLSSSTRTSIARTHDRHGCESWPLWPWHWTCGRRDEVRGGRPAPAEGIAGVGSAAELRNERPGDTRGRGSEERTILYSGRGLRHLAQAWAPRVNTAARLACLACLACLPGPYGLTFPRANTHIHTYAFVYSYTCSYPHLLIYPHRVCAVTACCDLGLMCKQSYLRIM